MARRERRWPPAVTVRALWLPDDELGWTPVTHNTYTAPGSALESRPQIHVDELRIRNAKLWRVARIERARDFTVAARPIGAPVGPWRVWLRREDRPEHVEAFDPAYVHRRFRPAPRARDGS